MVKNMYKRYLFCFSRTHFPIVIKKQTDKMYSLNDSFFQCELDMYISSNIPEEPFTSFWFRVGTHCFYFTFVLG